MNALEILLNNKELFNKFIETLEENTVEAKTTKGETGLIEYRYEFKYYNDSFVPYSSIKYFMDNYYNKYLDTVRCNQEDYTSMVEYDELVNKDIKSIRKN